MVGLCPFAACMNSLSPCANPLFFHLVSLSSCPTPQKWPIPHSVLGRLPPEGRAQGSSGGALGPTQTSSARGDARGRDPPADVTDSSYLSDRAGRGNRATAGYFIRSPHWLSPAEETRPAPQITAGNRTKWILITEIGKAINPGLQCFSEVTDRKPSDDWENCFLSNYRSRRKGACDFFYPSASVGMKPWDWQMLIISCK